MTPDVVFLAMMGLIVVAAVGVTVYTKIAEDRIRRDIDRAWGPLGRDEE